MQVTEWTDEMLAELCWQMANDPTFKGIERQGRGLRQIEMLVIMHWDKFAALAEKLGFPMPASVGTVSPDE